MTDAKPTQNKPCSEGCKSGRLDPLRRGLLLAGAAIAAGGLLPNGGRADDEDPRRKMRPQVGDQFVRFEGDQEGAVITAEDLHLGADPIIAWAMDPATKLPRDGSRLNQVLLLRLDPSSLGPETLKHAVDGIVAYSAICTHAQWYGRWLDAGIAGPALPLSPVRIRPTTQRRGGGGTSTAAIGRTPLES